MYEANRNRLVGGQKSGRIDRWMLSSNTLLCQDNVVTSPDGNVTRDSKTTTKLNKIKSTGTRDFNVKNPSNKEEKKPRAPANNTSLYQGEVTDR